MSDPGKSPSDPSLEEQRAYYDAWNTRHRDRDFAHIESESRARGGRVLELLRSLPPDPRRRILEVGCGTGWLSGELCAFGDVTAVDLSPAAVRIAEARGLPAHFVAGDFMTQAFAAAPFDVVVCVETLFYVEDQPAFVARMAEMLRPGGVLITTCVNRFVYERRHDIPPPVRGQIRKWLGRRDVLRLLASHFRVLSVDTVLPKGHGGVLRLVNSTKLNGVLERFVPAARIERAKERLGLGHTIVILASRRAR